MNDLITSDSVTGYCNLIFMHVLLSMFLTLMSFLFMTTVVQNPEFPWSVQIVKGLEWKC